MTEQVKPVADPSIPPDILRDFETLRAKLAQQPRDVPILNSLGIVYARAGQLREAVSLWNLAMSIDPKYIHLYNNLGSALKSLKRYDEARKIYHQGLTLAPSYWIHYNLGLLEQDCNRTAEAARCFQNCLKIFPTFEPAIRKLREMSASKIPLQNSECGQFPIPLPSAILARQPTELPSFETPMQNNRKEGPRLVIPEHPLSEEDCVKLINKFQATPAQKVVALTFDDGPHAQLTPQLLNFLQSEQILATFFLIGSRAETYPDIVSRMAAEGHEVGNHTWTHHSLVRLASHTALLELQQTADLISALTGKPCRLVRPPFGNVNSNVTRLITSQGWNQVMWDSDSRDWKGGTSDQAMRRVLKELFPGAIILFHDIHPLGLKVLPTLVRALKRCGYRFVTISQLMGLLKTSS